MDNPYAHLQRRRTNTSVIALVVLVVLMLCVGAVVLVTLTAKWWLLPAITQVRTSGVSQPEAQEAGTPNNVPLPPQQQRGQETEASNVPVQGGTQIFLYNPSKGPLYTIGMNTQAQEFRDKILGIFLPVEPLGVDVKGDPKSFPEDGILLGDCRVNGTPVWRDVDNEGEVTYIPANTQFNCEWWGRWYPAQKLRAGDALTREFLAGWGGENHGCQRMAWHWLEGGVIKNAYFDSLPALYTTDCGFWVGKKMPAGLSCLVEAGKKTTTVSSGGSFLTAPDGSVKWTPAAAGSTVFTGQVYIYSPQEFSVVSYQ